MMNTTNFRGNNDYYLRKTTCQKDQTRGGNHPTKTPSSSGSVMPGTSGTNRPPQQGARRPSMTQQQPPMSNSNPQRPDAMEAAQSDPDPNEHLLSEMRKTFSDFQVELRAKLDHVILDLDAVKNDLASVKSTMQDLEGSVADTSARISMVESDKIPNLERYLDQIKAEFEEKLMEQEIHHRKQNLLFYGIPAQPQEDIYKTASKAFAKILDIPIEEADNIQIVNAHRLPTKKTPSGTSGSPTAPDPVIVRFARMYDRDRVVRAFQQPRRQPTDRNGDPAAGERITVRTDLTARMKRERGRLAGIAYNIRKSQHLKTRITVHHTKVLLQTKNPNEPSSKWSMWSE
ncbi:uncharacterized protein [Diadema setosum]|uniref:uncharacterized protein n=1 Tax=Diadema setosum TaxID=31175 RepID=UPI003B3A9068